MLTELAAGQWVSMTATVGSGGRFRTARLFRSFLLASLALAVAGCFLMSRAPERPAPTVSGPAPYVETCATCHAVPTIAHYAESLHTAEGIRCGQCHTPDPNFSLSDAGHPKFSQPAVADGKCGGCHQPEYQQTLASKHFASRLQRSLNSDGTETVVVIALGEPPCRSGAATIEGTFERWSMMSYSLDAITAHDVICLFPEALNRSH